MGFLRWTFVVTRYGGLGLFIFYLKFLIPVSNHTNAWCQNAAAAIISFDLFVETLGNGIILYELVYLWGTSGIVAKLMASGYMVLHSAIVVAVIISIIQVKPNFHFLGVGDLIRICVVNFTPPAFKGIFIPGVVLDIYSFTLLLLNVLSRPRSTSQNLLQLLLSDGLIFFLTTLCAILSSWYMSDYLKIWLSLAMRFMCLFMSLLAPPDLGILGIVGGSIVVNLAVCRLFLRLHGRQIKYIHYDVTGILCTEEVLLSDGTELQFRRSMH